MIRVGFGMSLSSSPLTLETLRTRVQALPGTGSLVSALAAGGRREVRGLHGSSAALLLAAAAPAEGPALVVAADPEEADALALDLALFSGDPAAAAPFPAFGARDAAHRLREDRVLADRLAALEALSAAGREKRRPRFLVAPAAAALDGTPPPEALRAALRRVAPGDRTGPEEIARALDGAGFARVSRVESAGEWAPRGGVVDCFPFGRGGPVRIEWFGDEVASVRRFDPATQRSFAEEPGGLVLDLLPREALASPGTGTLLDHLPPGAWVVLRDPERIEEWVRRVGGHAAGVGAAWDRWREAAAGRPLLSLSSLPAAPGTEVPLRTAPVVDTARDPGRLGEVLARLARRDGDLLVCAGNGAEAHRFRTVVDALPLAPGERLRVRVQEGAPARPFRLPDLGVAVLSVDALYERHRIRRPSRGPLPEGTSAAPADPADLRPGDAVVHLAHGIAIYRGLEREERPGGTRESLVLEFRDGVRVSVPASRADLVHRYVGTRETSPRLSRYGSRDWGRRTEEVGRAVADVAAELLEVQALRGTRPGLVHPADGPEQAEFEASFPFADTPDQETASRAVKRDLEAPRPMDRLLCGDVGFGKTEIAVRAAFKCVLGGRQAAVLVPTTLLAQQHFETFTERFAGWPVSVEVLSRFRTRAEQKRVVERVAEGSVDVLVGTHRLLQEDVAFRDLGLVVIDEEQRFGVAHKQRLRSLRATVDVLTMTATPIPRTLHMALLGLRDASNLETPPEGRQPVETEVRVFGREWVREAILRELDRAGQVYFVHDRIASLGTAAAILQECVPEARLATVHGRLPEAEVEETMLRFARGEVDVLCATSIVENGLDFPNANTILIDRAHRFGLADLHQLRGRVGRGTHRAYCVLVVPDGPIATDAERRVRAVEEYAGLGEGHRIALRDLEIRGAGNLLGTEQSGHIASVGYEMYCRLLEEAVRRRRGMPVAPTRECTVDLPAPASLPPSWIPDARERIGAYRRLARTASPAEVEEALADLRDRFGAPPAEAAALADLARVRIAAAAAGADLVWQPEPDRVALRAEGDPRPLAAVLGRHGGRVRRVDDRTFHLLLPPGLPGRGLPRWVASALSAPEAPRGARPAARPSSARPPVESG